MITITDNEAALLEMILAESKHKGSRAEAKMMNKILADHYRKNKEMKQ
jgi:hypothetical protein|tara:strand:+ start:451 stop:594 length:144 start_codon:yes stop_codon:yes gene_type:complete